MSARDTATGSDDLEPDTEGSVDESELHGESEPPPPGDDFFSGMFTDPQPFAMPPDEPVELVGEVPWELRDDGTPPPAGAKKPSR